MGKVIDARDPHGAVEAERARVAQAFRPLAERLESTPREKLAHALPIAAAGLADVEHRLAPWLR